MLKPADPQAVPLEARLALQDSRPILRQYAKSKFEKRQEVAGAMRVWLALLPPEGTDAPPPPSPEADDFAARIVGAAADHSFCWLLCYQVMRGWQRAGFPVPDIMVAWWLEQSHLFDPWKGGYGSAPRKPGGRPGRPRHRHRDEQVRTLAALLREAGMKNQTDIAHGIALVAQKEGVPLTEPSVLKILAGKNSG